MPANSRAASLWGSISSHFCVAALFAFLDVVVHHSGHTVSGLDVCRDLFNLPLKTLVAFLWTFL